MVNITYKMCVHHVQDIWKSFKFSFLFVEDHLNVSHTTIVIMSLGELILSFFSTVIFAMFVQMLFTYNMCILYLQMSHEVLSMTSFIGSSAGIVDKWLVDSNLTLIGYSHNSTLSLSHVIQGVKNMFLSHELKDNFPKKIH